MTKSYIGDTGTAIVLDTGQALAGALSQTIEVRKPDGTLTTWSATVVESTKIQHVTLAGTLAQAGLYRLQAHVVMPSGEWLGEVAQLTVYPEFS